MPVTHTFVSAIVDDPAAAAAGQVLPSHWNAIHTISVDMAEINATGTPSASTVLYGDGRWATPTQIQPAAENTDTTCFPLFVNAASGTAQQPKYNSSLVFNASTGSFGALSADSFIPKSSTVPAIGMYAPSSTSLAFVSNSRRSILIDASNYVTIDSSSSPIAAGLTINTNLNGGMILSSSNASGPGFNLNQTTNTNFQFYNNNAFFGVYNATLGATPFAVFGGASARITTTAGGVIGWAAGASNADQPPDTGFTRLAAGVIGNAGVFKSAGMAVGIRVVTAAGAIVGVVTDGTVVINKTVAAASTYALPTTATAGQIIIIKDGKGDANTNNITVTAASGNVEGVIGTTGYVITTNKDSVSFQYDGTNWWVV